MNSKLFDAPQIDSATIDHYLARGRRERARVFSEMIRGIFSSPAGRSAASRSATGRSAEVHTLAVRDRTEPATAKDRARAA